MSVPLLLAPFVLLGLLSLGLVVLSWLSYRAPGAFFSNVLEWLPGPLYSGMAYLTNLHLRERHRREYFAYLEFFPEPDEQPYRMQFLGSLPWV